MSCLKYFLLLFMCFLSGTLLAQSQYVGAGGRDRNNAGDSPTDPYATLPYAIGKLSPGDTLFVLSGTYSNPTFGTRDFFKPQNDCAININGLDGAPGQYITIKPYEANGVVLKADGLSVALIKNSSYLRLEGFEVYGETENIPLDTALQYQFLYRDADGDWQYRFPPNTPANEVEGAELPSLAGQGISRPTYFNTAGITANSSHHIEIVNNVVHHMPGEGIRSFTSDYLWIMDNEVFECSRRSATGVHGLSVYDAQSIDENDDTKIWMLRNRVYRNYNEVYSWSTTKTFITPHIDEGKGLTVQRCTAARGWEHGRIRMQNNISYRNGLSGININTGERVDIYHNSLYNNSLSYEVTGVGTRHGIAAQSSGDVRIINNAVMTDPDLSTGLALHISSNTNGVVIEDNLIFGGMNNAADNIDVNTITTSPLFTDAGGGDLNLQPGSPAIDLGSTGIPVVNDFFNTPRDASPDLGAIEFQQVLPVELLFFTATAEGNKVVRLNWSTGAETDNAYFTVERSATGQEWEAIGRESGSGTISGRQSYRMSDEYPLTGVSFYRLRQTDHDGASRVSAIHQVSLQKIGELLVYPNPAQEQITLSGLSAKGHAPIILYNAFGREIYRLIDVALDGQDKLSLDLRGLAPGTYFLQTAEGSITFVKR